MKPSDLTKESNESSVVAFHNFVLLKRKYKQDLFCFFEGKDDPKYYYERIKNTTNVEHHPIICGNKKTVIHLYNEIKDRKEYKIYKKAFFIDLDFDDKNTIKDIYETPYYSIENFYVDKKVLSDILKNEFGLLETDNNFTTIINFYVSEQKKYNECSKLFNAWYATLKKEASDKKIKLNVSLNEKIPKELIVLKIGNISCDYELSDIEKLFPKAMKINKRIIDEKIKEFKGKTYYKIFRGKYEIEFLYKFLQFLIEDANNVEKRKFLKKKTKFRIDKALIISQLSKYAETPACLIDYLKKFN